MVKNRKQILKTCGIIMGVSCLLAVGFTVNGNSVDAKAEGALGVEWTTTKYKVSGDGNYALVLTAFKADEVLQNTENNYIIGYEINGEESMIGYGKKYYETVSLKTSETESVSYTAGQVFGSDYADYLLNVYEIENFDVSEDYTVKPFIKQIAVDGENGYTVMEADYGAENTIDVKTITFDTKGGEPIAPKYVQNGTTFGEMPVAVKENCEFGRWSENLTGQAITEDVTVSVMWKVEDITDQFVWQRTNSGYPDKTNAGVYTNYANSKETYGIVYGSDANWCYTKNYVDISAYVGMTLRITLPDAKSFGLVFADETATGVGARTGTKYADGWYANFYDQSGNAKEVDLVIPEGAKYVKTTYYWDRTDKLPFSAKILDGYTVNFDTKGGTAIESQFVWYGETVEIPENPTLAGATFQGWDTDLTKPVTSGMTVTATWKYEDQDISELFSSWKKNYGIYVNKTNNPSKYTSVYWSTTYKYAVVDVTNYQGRTLKITLPTSSGYGMIFTQDNDVTSEVQHADSIANKWYYCNPDGNEYTEVTIPTVESGKLYIMVTMRQDATSFSAIVLGD